MPVQWILSPSRPKRALDELGFQPEGDWPSGFYRGAPGYLWVVYGGLMLQVFYYTWSYYQLEGYHSFGKLVKTFLVSLFAIGFWTLLTMTFIALYIYRNSHFLEFFTQQRR